MMMGKARLHWMVAAVSVGVMGSFGGCSCENKITPSGEVRLSFSFPLDKATLASPDDVNDSLDGIQVNITGVASGFNDGSMLALTNSLSVDSTGVPIPTTADVVGGRISFPGYTIPEGDGVVLRLSRQGVASDEVCTGSNCAEVRVRVAQNVCLFVSPLDGDVLNTDAYPDGADPFDPFETDVTLECQGVDEGDNVALSVNGGIPTVAKVDADARVTFARVRMSEGANALAASSRTDEAGANAQGATSTIAVEVETARCAATLFPRDGQRFVFEDDADLDASNGMQAAFDVVTDCAATSTVRLYVRGPGDTVDTLAFEGTPTANSDPAGTRFRITGIDLPESVSAFDVEVIAQVEESATISGYSLRQRYWVDTLAPALDASVPVQSACIGPAADNDSDLSNGVQIDFATTYTGAADGTLIYAYTRTSESSPVCADTSECSGPTTCIDNICRYTSTVTDSAAVIENVDLPGGSAIIVLYGVDPAGNTGDPVEVSLFVVDRVPQVTIQTPVEGAAITVSDDISTTDDGIQYIVQVCSEDVMSGSTAILSTGETSRAFVPISPGGCVDIASDFLFSGPHALQATVTDSCGLAPGSSVVTNIELTPALLQVTAVIDSTPVADNTETAALTVDLDLFSGPGLGGDRTLTVRATDAATVDADSNRTCSGSELVAPFTAATVGATDDGVLVAAQPLAGGFNCFELVLTDGDTSRSTTVVVVRRTAAQVPTITDPTGAVALTVDLDADSVTDGMQYSVVVTLPLADTTAGVMAVDVGGFFTLTEIVPIGATSITFTNANLPEGQYALTPTYRDAFGFSGVGAPVAITVNTGGLPIALSAPTPDSITADAALSATVVLTGVGSSIETCDLLVDGVVVLNDAPWTNGATTMNFVAPSPLAEGNRTVVVECNDSGTIGSTPSVTYTIDQTAPSAPAFVNEVDTGNPVRWNLTFDAPNQFVNGFVNDVSGGTAGLQHNITWQLNAGSEDPTGWTVDLVVTPPGGSATTYSTDITTNTPTMSVTLVNVDFGTAEGNILFSLTATDAAGNVSTPQTATLTIDTTPPGLTQTLPDPLQAVLSRNDDKNFDIAFVDIAFSYTTTDVSGNVELTIGGPQSPDNYNSFPVTVDGSSGTATIPTGVPFAFLDGTGYSASALAYDAAGNLTSLTYAFEIEAVQPNADWTQPSAGTTVLTSALNDAGSPGDWRGTFGFVVYGFDASTSARLCSSVDPGGATACASGGFVVGTTLIAGNQDSASATFTGVSLAEAMVAVDLHLEINAGPKQATSVVRSYTVDSVPPTVDTISIAADAAPTGFLSDAERTAGAVVVRVAVTGAEGEVAELLVNGVSLGTPATATVTSGNADITVALPEGDLALTARVSDAVGNANTASATLNIVADYTAPSVAVPAATKSPYNGSDDQIKTPNRSSDLLELDFNITASDNRDLDGTTLEIERVQDLAGTPFGPRQGVASFVFGAGAGTAVANIFADYALQPGANYIMATITDEAGNSQSSVVQQYNTDLYGPLLTLAIYDAPGSATTGCGADRTNFCVADIIDPAVTGSNIAVLDDNATLARTYCPAERTTILGKAPGSCPELGTDLFIGMTECQSVPSLENCETTPITIVLESESVLADGSGAGYSAVATFNSGQLTTPNATVTPEAVPGTLSFDPSVVRRIRLRTTDSSGNQSLSNEVYLGIGLTGLSITVVRVDTGGVEQEDLSTTPYIGLSSSEAGDGSPIVADLRVILTPQGIPLPSSPTVTLSLNTVDQTSSTPMPLAGDRATFDNVSFVSVADLRGAGGDNTIVVNVTSPDCAGSCGTATVTLRADNARPTYQFDRVDLCTLSVPMGGTTCDDGGAAANTAEATADGISGLAQWSQSNDTAGGSAGFQPGEITVLFKGIENGHAVTLSGGTGNPVPANNSASTVNCATDVGCTANFTALSLTSLTGNGAYRISVEARDTAGNLARAVRDGGTACFGKTTQGTCDADSNCAWVDVGFCALQAAQIQATTDTEEPASISLTICSDSSAPGCTTPCSGATCDRQSGSVAVSWAEPAEDYSGSAVVAGYQVQAVAVHVDYSGSLETDCATYDGALSDTGVGFSLPSPATVGASVVAQLSNLLPHRRYCVRVQALDDVGNFSDAVGGHDLPFFAYPTAAATFEPDVAVRDDAPDAQAFVTASRAGFAVANLGDLDGDGGDDFAISVNILVNPGPGANLTDPADDVGASVWIYLSANADPGVPAVRIRGATRFFGRQMVSGFFNQDNYPDLAIEDSSAAGGFGAVYIYYGGAAGIASINASNVDATGALIDADLPGYRPSQTLIPNVDVNFGQSGLVAGNIDNDAPLAGVNQGTDDLLLLSLFSVDIPAAGFLMTPGRFSTDKETITVTSPASPSVGGATYDFVVDEGTETVNTAAIADIDGDGFGDVAVGSSTATKIWIFGGARVGTNAALGQSLTMNLSMAPTATAAGATAGSPLNVLRFPGALFGAAVHRIPAPGTNSADWLAVQARNSTVATSNEVIIFKGRGTLTNPGVLMPTNNTCTNSALDNIEVCATGLAQADFDLLNLSSWKNQETSNIGYSLAANRDFIVMGRRRVAAGDSNPAGHMVLMMRYDAADDAAGNAGFLRHMIVVSPTRQRFGQRVLLLDGYLDTTTNNLQIGVGNDESTGGNFFLYR